MARICDLVPGNIVRHAGMSATFIAQMPHPLYAGIQLVIWWMDRGEYSFDALSAYQEVGDVDAWTAESLKTNLRRALVGPRTV